MTSFSLSTRFHNM